MSKKDFNNYGSRTFFVVLHDKAIANMGIEVNWNDMEYMQSQLDCAFRDVSNDYYATICESAKEKKHVHLAITYPKTKRRTAVAKELGNAHTEEMRGTKEQALDYVNKEGKFQEKGEKILAKIGDPNRLKDNTGMRVDYNRIRLLIDSGEMNASNLNELAFIHGTSPGQVDSIKSFYRDYMLAKADLMGNLREVKVIYVEGQSGSGKTYLALQNYKDAFIADTSEKTAFPFNGYQGQKTLILDELRPGVFKPAELFRILDRYKLLLNVKGGQFPAMWTTVIICTACPLYDWFKKKEDNEGQDNNREQFLRRIHEHLRAVVDEWEIDPLSGRKRAKSSHWEPYDKKEQPNFTQMSIKDIEDCPFL